MPNQNKLIAERLNRIDSIPRKLNSGVGKIQSELFAELLAILSELDIGGSFVLSTENLVRIDTLINQYYTVLKNGKYGSYVNWYLSELDAQKALNDKIFKASFNAVAAGVSQSTYQIARQKAVRQLLGDDFKTNFVNVVKDQLLSSLQGKADFSELKNDLYGLFHETERLPIMERWVKGISSDTFATADRAYNNAVADDLGLVFFQYTGGIIKETREFCELRAEEVYHVNEAKEWVSEEWAGKFRKTTEENILQWLGGYNCQHSVSYVSLSLVPTDVIQRNIANGNFSPTAAEKAALGI